MSELIFEKYFKNELNDAKMSDRYNKKIKLETMLYYLSLKENRRLSTPTIIGLDITSRCNLNCSHCFQQREANEELEISLTEIKDQLTLLKEEGLYQTYIMGGEPFMRKDILDIIKCIKDLNLTVSINSNGTLISDKDILFLKNILNKDTDWIQISLDSLKEEISNEIRGIGNLALVLSTIKKLTKHGIPVKINTVVMKNNLDDLLNIYLKAIELGVTRIAFNPLYPYKNMDFDNVPSQKEYYTSFSKILECHELSKSKILLQQDPLCIPYSFEEFKNIFENEENIPYFNCRAGIYSCEIDSKGDVYPCSFLHDEFFKAGSIKNNNIIDIWRNNNNWVTLLDNDSDLSKCKTCKYINPCKGGCIAAKFDLYKTIHGADPNCKFIGGI